MTYSIEPDPDGAYKPWYFIVAFRDEVCTGCQLELPKGLNIIIDFQSKNPFCSVGCWEITKKETDGEPMPSGPRYLTRFRSLFWNLLKDMRVEEPGIMKDKPFYDVLLEFAHTAYKEGQLSVTDPIQPRLSVRAIRDADPDLLRGTDWKDSEFVIIQR